MAESAAVARLRTTLDGYLKEIFPPCQTDSAGDFVIPGQRSIAWVRPLEWADHTLARIWSITNVDMRADAALARFILAENGRLIFGGFALDRDRPAVAFGHSLLGDFLQRKELEIAIGAVVTTADQYAEQIKARFGGRLFTEGP